MEINTAAFISGIVSPNRHASLLYLDRQVLLFLSLSFSKKTCSQNASAISPALRLLPGGMRGRGSRDEEEDVEGKKAVTPNPIIRISYDSSMCRKIPARFQRTV